MDYIKESNKILNDQVELFHKCVKDFKGLKFCTSDDKYEFTDPCMTSIIYPREFIESFHIRKSDILVEKRGGVYGTEYMPKNNDSLQKLYNLCLFHNNMVELLNLTEDKPKLYSFARSLLHEN